MTADRDSSATATEPLRVLIVEDSKRLREQLGESITSPGRIEVVGYAETEAEALHVLEDAPCDAVVLDLQLRQGNGLAVLKALRASPSGERIIVIVLTNFAFPHFRERSIKLGANYFFDKAREYDRVRDVLEELAARPSHL
jgi:DNA-binding NarL/FixJ family response regulator